MNAQIGQSKIDSHSSFYLHLYSILYCSSYCVEVVAVAKVRMTVIHTAVLSTSIGEMNKYGSCL
jgi:hypothetical protein